MFNIFNKKLKKKEVNIFYIKVASLLIHAAKIDELYTEIEKKIIKKTLLNLGAKNEEIRNILEEAEKKESQSNQIIEFTKDIKKIDKEEKKKIIESLWKIIYSDHQSDIYESNLMRRLTGLLYLDSKTVGDIKEKIKLEQQNDLSSK